MVVLIEGTSDDLGQPGRPERGPGALGMACVPCPWAASASDTVWFSSFRLIRAVFTRDLLEPAAAQFLGHLHQSLALGGAGLLVDDQHRRALSG